MRYEPTKQEISSERMEFPTPKALVFLVNNHREFLVTGSSLQMWRCRKFIYDFMIVETSEASILLTWRI